MNVFVCVYVRNSRKINWREKNSYDGFSVDSSTVINNRFYRSFLMLTRHEVYKKGDFDVHTNELIIKFKTDKISHLWHTFIRTYHADYVRNKTTKKSTRAYSTHIILHAFMESAGRHARMPVACLYHVCFWPLNENRFKVAEWTNLHSNVTLGVIIFWAVSYDAFMYTFRKLSNYYCLTILPVITNYTLKLHLFRFMLRRSLAWLIFRYFLWFSQPT